MVRARMTDNAGQRDVCIIDISTRGLLATTACPPKRGEIVEIQIGNNAIVGQVRWASARRFGLALRERVSIAAVVEGGKTNIALAVSQARMAKKPGLLTALLDNPHFWGRFAEFVITAIVALAAAYLISELTMVGFEPMVEAMGSVGDSGSS